jgi:hypothetical protein
VNLKKWHQHPPGRPDALLDAVGQLADAGGFRDSSHRLDVPGSLHCLPVSRHRRLAGPLERRPAGGLLLAASWPG